MIKIQVNKENCTGCRICQLVCSLQFSGGGVNIRRAALRVKEINLYEEDYPVLCRHCGGGKPLSKAPCARACPSAAFYVDERSGALAIDEEKCTRCGACVEACPFAALEMTAPDCAPAKCNLCAGRDNGPICAEYCPTAALFWEDPHALKAEAAIREGGAGA